MTRPDQQDAPQSQQISHPAHPEHKLQLAVTTLPFKCDGCMQQGSKKSYRCEACDYDIHICCVPPKTILEHPLLGCKLDFLPKPPGPGRWCNACGEDVLGFMYYNRQHDIDLHPACAVYPKRLRIDGVMFDLHTEKVAAQICHKCQKNGRRNSFWSYHSKDEDGKLVYLHVGCLVDEGAGSTVVDEIVPTELLNAPGEITWYRKAWKLTKVIAKLCYFFFTLNWDALTEAGEDVADAFGN